LETQLTNTIERNAVLEREMANMRERVERLEEANMRDRGETQREMANMLERGERLEEASPLTVQEAAPGAASLQHASSGASALAGGRSEPAEEALAEDRD
jgi:hypothetical protein